MSESKGKTGGDKENQPSFEKALTRLEKIVAEMEGGELELESMIRRFEEGQKLIGFCSRTLNEVEKKVEKLVRKDGKVEAVPFDQASAASEGAGPAKLAKKDSAESEELF